MSPNQKPANQSRFKNFADFYLFYLGEHSKRGTRLLHFIGSSGTIAFLITTLVTRRPQWILAGAVCGYFFAWISHFFIEKNRPATFKYPFYSLAADFVLFYDLLTGKQKFG